MNGESHCQDASASRQRPPYADQQNYIKQYLVIRNDIKMSKSKMLLSAMRAAWNVFLAQESKPHGFEKIRAQGLRCFEVEKWSAWLDHHCPQRCVFVNSEGELLEIYNSAKRDGVPCHLVKNYLSEGSEQQEYICCAIGPAQVRILESLCGSTQQNFIP